METRGGTESASVIELWPIIAHWCTASHSFSAASVRHRGEVLATTSSECLDQVGASLEPVVLCRRGRYSKRKSFGGRKLLQKTSKLFKLCSLRMQSRNQSREVLVLYLERPAPDECAGGRSPGGALLIQRLEGSRPHKGLCTLNGAERVQRVKTGAARGKVFGLEGYAGLRISARRLLMKLTEASGAPCWSR